MGISDGFAPIPPPTFCPLLVSLCKKTKECYYDTDYTIKEKIIMDYNFTADFRFLNQKTTKEFISEFKRIGQDPAIFEEECKKCEIFSKKIN